MTLNFAPENAETFADAAALHMWLARHGATRTDLWVHLHKVSTGLPSVTWEDCVKAALCHGWIDGIKRSAGPHAWLQRLTPRKPKSPWSRRNRDHAERLIAEGRMTPAGLAQVHAAQADGRWDAAYAGPAKMEIPVDFLAALAAHPTATATFATLDRQNLYAIYYRLQTAATPEARARRMAKLIATLDAGQTFH